jgi:hypothetical protein
MPLARFGFCRAKISESRDSIFRRFRSTTAYFWPAAPARFGAVIGSGLALFGA